MVYRLLSCLLLTALALPCLAASNEVAQVGQPSAAVTAVAGTNAVKRVSRPARITSKTTYYDRKEGVAILTGNVHVDDEKYQLHADKAYVFTSGTNDLERIVAIGNIALTNENKRAYGSKVTYYRNRGMVVLHSGEGRPAEVREVKKDGDQVVRGRKIKFWVDSEQVEVVEADITAPMNLGGDGLKSLR